MQSSSKQNYSKNKQLLLDIIGKTVKEYRQKAGKGILLHSYEYDIPSSSLNLLEKGKRDPQLTTLWKIANSFNMTFGEFISIIEKELPDNFLLTEDK